MKHLFFLLCTCLHISATAQNLVPNPGFEKFTNLPQGFNGSPEAYSRCVNDWKVPNKTTPDYIAPGFLGGKLFGISHDGLGMTGLDIASNWAECIYARLKEGLEANTTYLIEFWIKRSESDFQASEGAASDCLPGFVSRNFGILLTDTLQLAKNKEFIVGLPQLRCGERFWVGKEWIKVSGYYTTDKNYRYVYVGQFRPEGENGWQAASRYVLIDDILIRKLNLADQFGHDTLITMDTIIPLVQANNDSLNTTGAIIPLDQVYFETDKSVLEERSYAALDTLATLLNSCKIHIRINGHTDNQGETAHNQKLSEERAKAVYDYLVSKDVDKKRLSWAGFGASKPKEDNATESGRQKNRRVEFEILQE